MKVDPQRSMDIFRLQWKAVSTFFTFCMASKQHNSGLAKHQLGGKHCCSTELVACGACEPQNINIDIGWRRYEGNQPRHACSLGRGQAVYLQTLELVKIRGWLPPVLHTHQGRTRRMQWSFSGRSSGIRWVPESSWSPSSMNSMFFLSLRRGSILKT